MDGPTEARQRAAADALSGLLAGPLDVYVEVRDARTGVPLYSVLAARNVSEGDEITAVHKIGVQALP